MEETLGLAPLSQIDFCGRPLRDIFVRQPDLRSFAAIKPEQFLTETNPSTTKNAEAFAKLNLDKVDRADMNLFNQILWKEIKGSTVAYPQTQKCRRSKLREDAKITLLDWEAVALTCRLRDDEKFNRLGGFIKYLMRNFRRNFRSFVLLQNFSASRNFERRRAFEDEEKLLRPIVIMPNFHCSGRHPLVNNAQFHAFN